MKRMMLALLCSASVFAVSGCANLAGGTNLGQVADEVGLSNVTTGDGTFENYKATGYYTSTEIGIAVGIPFLVKLVELYPVQNNEDHLKNVATAAKDDGANALINVTPPQESYYGFPFGIVGIYIDRTDGTGINQRR